MRLIKGVILCGLDKLTIIQNGLRKLPRRFYEQQHQLTSFTSTDRYPELFLESVKAAPQHENLKILSFGCSTGEECFSLKKYFPKAKIIGVDINTSNLKKANRANKYTDLKFIHSSKENIKAEGTYNLIFCLSVLCRWDDTKNVKNCEKIYPFRKFCETVSMLVDELKVNGLLIIYNSNFRFEDTPYFKDFEIMETVTITSSGFVNKFDAQNVLIEEPHKACIYRKIR